MRPDKPMGSMSLLQGMGPNGCYLPFGTLCAAHMHAAVLRLEWPQIGLC